MYKIYIILFSMTLSFAASAGIDLTGKIERVYIEEGENFWFKFSHPEIDKYCKSGWFGFNASVKKSDKDFPYYYGLIISAMTNKQSVRLSNINVFNGSQACDIVKTSYGMVVHAP